MCNDDAALADRPFENVYVRSANQSLFFGCAHVAAARSKAADDIGSDVLVGQSRVFERLHAVIFSSQVCSPLSCSSDLSFVHLSFNHAFFLQLRDFFLAHPQQFSVHIPVMLTQERAWAQLGGRLGQEVRRCFVIKFFQLRVR